MVASPETPMDFISGEKTNSKVKKAKKGRPKKLLNEFVEP